MHDLERDPLIDKYLDIIDLPHPEPTTFSRMPRQSRAAEFSSFEALDGLREQLERARRIHEQQSGAGSL